MSAEAWSVMQPNFLQKLYQFLNLDPHPCPEVIYWAADSRQLVIAQPDRLVKEVLPRLFKHDKLASFGRQLNIYGFSRLFPGRQFKDADGKVSEASVWAHPTLHRLSTFDEVLAIKRRAAPKLIRTRRLANGQVVRTRAGPAVEARFHEIRASMADSRRTKLTAARHPALELTASAATRSPISQGALQHPSPAQLRETSYSDARDYHESLVKDEIERLDDRLDDGWVPTLDDIAEEYSQDHGHQPLFPYVVNSGRMYHSAPASIRTSPLLPAPVLASPGLSWPPRETTFEYLPNQSETFHSPTSPTFSIVTPSASWPMAPPASVAATPASSPPAIGYDVSPQLKNVDAFYQQDTVYPSTYDTYPHHGTFTTIDPRWVSPNGSCWPTPASTPRSSSPLALCDTSAQGPGNGPLSGSRFGDAGGAQSWMSSPPSVPLSLPLPVIPAAPVIRSMDVFSPSDSRYPKQKASEMPASADVFLSNYAAASTPVITLPFPSADRADSDGASNNRIWPMTAD